MNGLVGGPLLVGGLKSDSDYSGVEMDMES